MQTIEEFLLEVQQHWWYELDSELYYSRYTDGTISLKVENFISLIVDSADFVGFASAREVVIPIVESGIYDIIAGTTGNVEKMRQWLEDFPEAATEPARLEKMRKSHDFIKRSLSRHKHDKELYRAYEE